MTDLELKHYGVKGMRWGVRRDSKSKLYDKHGFRTKKGHEIEKERRKKLTPGQSDAELESLYKGNNRTSRHRLSAETKQFVADGYSGKGKTKALQKEMRSYRKAIKSGKEQAEKHRQRIDSLTLSELGYADTERGRQIIRDYWNETFF